MEIQRASIITEMMEVRSNAYDRLRDLIDDAFPLEELPHEELKKRSAGCTAHIRTGECTPYCNIILEGGVTF